MTGHRETPQLLAGPWTPAGDTPLWTFAEHQQENGSPLLRWRLRVGACDNKASTSSSLMNGSGKLLA